MVSQRLPETSSTWQVPTLWGLTPEELHDRFWKIQGIQVVRKGQPLDAGGKASRYLLAPPGFLGLFTVRRVARLFGWLKPEALFFRVEQEEMKDYGEVAVVAENLRPQRIRRVYRERLVQAVQVCLTSHVEIARLWSESADGLDWQALQKRVKNSARYDLPVAGRFYNAGDLRDLARCARDLIEACPKPDALVGRARRLRRDVWVDRESHVDRRVRAVGRVWIGAGRRLDRSSSLVGPTILWDIPESRPERSPPSRTRLRASNSIALPSLSHTALAPAARDETKRPSRMLYFFSKRLFDILFSLAALAITLPFYPVVMLAILLQDGWPFIFIHRRETLGGKPFLCLKFRTMKKNAEKVKVQLMKENQVDGPQFFIREDPRLLRFGHLMRRYKIDELPQFINVLLGQMSVIGPRPSPFEENQYCPAWREARLSVQPGITGLWQVMRTRRKGLDFQEWIRYDIEYAEKAGFKLDLWILWKTFGVILKGK